MGELSVWHAGTQMFTFSEWSIIGKEVDAGHVRSVPSSVTRGLVCECVAVGARGVFQLFVCEVFQKLRTAQA